MAPSQTPLAATHREPGRDNAGVSFATDITRLTRDGGGEPDIRPRAAMAIGCR